MIKQMRRGLFRFALAALTFAIPLGSGEVLVRMLVPRAESDWPVDVEPLT